MASLIYATAFFALLVLMVGLIQPHWIRLKNRKQVIIGIVLSLLTMVGVVGR